MYYEGRGWLEEGTQPLTVVLGLSEAPPRLWRIITVRRKAGGVCSHGVNGARLDVKARKPQKQNGDVDPEEDVLGGEWYRR